MMSGLLKWLQQSYIDRGLPRQSENYLKQSMRHQVNFTSVRFVGMFLGQVDFIIFCAFWNTGRNKMWKSLELEQEKRLNN